jgi:HlyD family secretion protein
LKGFVSEQIVDAARAELAGATARLQQAKKKLDLVDEQNRLEIANAESRVKQEEAALETAKANTAQVSITRHELDVARSAYAQALAADTAAKAGRIQNKMREDEVREAQATVAQLANSLREVQVRQFDTTLVAAMSGVVTKRYIEQGELITSGVSTFSSGTPVMQIADLSRMLIKMSVNEVDVQKIRLGLPVEITVDAAKGGQFKGRVTKRAPAAVSAATAGQDGQGGGGGGSAGAMSVVRFAVEVMIDNPDSRLKPGMSAKCGIIVDRRKDVLRLPNDGIEGAGVTAKAQVVTKGSKDGKPADVVTAKSVTVGLRGDTHVEIMGGLKQGDRVKPGAYTGPKRKAMDMDMGPG